MSEVQGLAREELRARTFPVILSGPSGAGKTSIRDRLLEAAGGPNFLFSVSMTTRDPRPGEEDGVDYLFVTRREFEGRVEAGEMLEHAEVHEDLYGTPRANLEAAAARGAHLLLDIDVQGARQVRDRTPEAVSIFVMPPTGRHVRERLRRRASETPDELAKRLSSARTELEAVAEFDYVVVNDALDEAIASVRSIVIAEEASVRRLEEPARARASRVGREIEAGDE